MAKKEKEVKVPKAKSAKKLQKEAIRDEKKKVEVKIDAKYADLKATKDKAKRKEICIQHFYCLHCFVVYIVI